MEEPEAIETLKVELPGFVPEDHGTDEHGGPLFHMVMADLWRYYGTSVEGQEIEQAFWRTMERLAVEGSPSVENAVAVSFIENFLHDEADRRRFHHAGRLQGPKTRQIFEEMANWRPEF